MAPHFIVHILKQSYHTEEWLRNLLSSLKKFDEYLSKFGFLGLRNNTNQAFFLLIILFFPNFSSQITKTCHNYILVHISKPCLSSFKCIYFTFLVIFFTVIIFYSIMKKFWKTPKSNFPRKHKCLNKQDTHKFVTEK